MCGMGVGVFVVGMWMVWGDLVDGCGWYGGGRGVVWYGGGRGVVWSRGRLW